MMDHEKSHALPASRYGDPANIVEYDQMDAMGCRVCKSHTEILCKSVCSDERNKFQKGVPNIGHHCNWFSERG